jgi:hypothetical membrane protein
MSQFPDHVRWRSWCFRLTIAAVILFLILLHVSMYLYNGGTIHRPNLDSYSFTYNFLSDLGRNRTPGGAANFPSNLLFKSAMTLTGFVIAVFFVALPGVFEQTEARSTCHLAALAGIVAGASYVGLAWIPYDFSYGGHRLFVRVGFVSFLVMSLLFALAIFQEKDYPKKYGYVLLIFIAVLFSQILLMFLGERSWRSNDALFRQATAQKVVVYAEVLCMLYQTLGAMTYDVHRQKR